ncbi:MAG TPA: PHP domain-containing protein [Bryobacteraceae bacterium]
MIDLHTHTNESDGSYTPAELIDHAVALKLEALAISDHDTFAGYDQAVQPAADAGLDLVCAIELGARTSGTPRRTVHLLGYFLHQPPSAEFRGWLDELLTNRRERNLRLIDKLRSVGVEIELSDVERIGRTLTGRPHFARVLVHKGYAANTEEAFRRYLGESAAAFVERQQPDANVGIRRILAGGGLPFLAHPGRLGIRDPGIEEHLISSLKDAGLKGIEVYHSDHGPADVERYKELAKKYELAVSGGSDFHGEAKPRVALGSGVGGNVNVPKSVLERLRE